MTRDRSPKYLVGQVRELLKLPKETEWAEFKHDNDNPQEIGETISALANSAALSGKAYGYLLWGLDNTTRAILGTNFIPSAAKKGLASVGSLTL